MTTCKIWFTVERECRVSEVEILTRIDMAEEFVPQAIEAINAWILRKEMFWNYIYVNPTIKEMFCSTGSTWSKCRLTKEEK